MKIAILGAKGFLGSYLCRSFSVAHDVVPVTRDNLNLSSYMAVDHWLKDVKPDAIVNCAVSGGGSRIDDINYSDVQRDYGIFLNFFNNLKTPKYINVGSGAEFDRRRNISDCQEHEILNSTPLESYSYVKNIIARSVLNRDRFHTLRLFGCFDKSDPNIRLFARFLSQGHIDVFDRYFDYISASDFARIVEYFCVNEIEVKDVNCVYPDKLLLSTQLKIFKELHIPNGIIKHSAELTLSYTGYAAKLTQLGIPLRGLLEGIKEYR